MLEMFHRVDDGTFVQRRVGRHVGAGWKVAELMQSRD